MPLRPSPAGTAALLAVALSGPAVADAQSQPPPGQFGGAAPGQFQPDPAQPTAPAAPAPNPFGGMNAGGLAPPAPEAPPAASGPPTYGDPAAFGAAPPASSTDEDLDRAKKEDAGRGLTWFWVEVGGGFEHVGLQTFNVDEAAFNAGFIETSASGAVIDGGLGARLLFLTLGARGRLGFFAPWELARVGGEIGLRVPIGRIEPRVDAGFGYAALTGVSSTGGAAIDASIDGVYGRLGAGLDVYPLEWLAVGGGISWEVLALSRPGLSLADIAGIEEQAEDDPAGASATALAAEGSGYGSSIAITARVGAHF